MLLVPTIEHHIIRLECVLAEETIPHNNADGAGKSGRYQDRQHLSVLMGPDKDLSGAPPR